MENLFCVGRAEWRLIRMTKARCSNAWLGSNKAEGSLPAHKGQRSDYGSHAGEHGDGVEYQAPRLAHTFNLSYAVKNKTCLSYFCLSTRRLCIAAFCFTTTCMENSLSKRIKRPLGICISLGRHARSGVQGRAYFFVFASDFTPLSGWWVTASQANSCNRRLSFSSRQAVVFAEASSLGMGRPTGLIL